MKFSVICFVLVGFFSAQLAHSGQATVAVASNFTAPAKALQQAFAVRTEHSIRLSFSSTGKIYTQINKGAPFDIFLSADQERPKLLAEQGLASMPITYAVGEIALWAPGLDLRPLTLKNNVMAPEALLNTQAIKLAIANPKLAPYGVAAEQTLAKLGLIDSPQITLVRGENISQAYQFVHSGNATMGLIALAQAHGLPEDSSVWRVPNSLHDPIKQDAILLNKSADNQAAQAFMTFLVSPEAQAIIQRFGYSTP